MLVITPIKKATESPSTHYYRFEGHLHRKPMSRYSDLEITFTRRAEDSYSLGFRFKGAGDAAEQQSPIVPVITLPSFALAGDDPRAYAEALTSAFFTSEVRAEFNRFRAAALSNSSLRVRLSIDAQAPELHAIHWEMLRDPDSPEAESTHLFTGEQILVSRFLGSADRRQIKLPPKSELRALAVVANPASSKYQLDPIDVPAEIQLATQSMSGVHVTPLAPGGAVSLNTLAAKLREGFDILYLVCHGRVVEALPYLFLDDGPPNPGQELAQAIGESDQRPRMVVLVSCQSAGKDGSMYSLCVKYILPKIFRNSLIPLRKGSGNLVA
jgi:hypothetical protein